MKKVLFYCDTSYQILTVINIILGREEKASYDLVIYHQFYNSDIISEKLRQCGLFDTIYEAYPPLSKKNDLLRLVNCKEYLEKELHLHSYYDEIFFAILDTHTSLAIYTSCNYKTAYLYDDGTGSYRGNTVFECLGWKRHLLLKFFHPSVHYFKFSKFYLYSPSLNISPLRKEKITFHKSSLIEEIFGYKENYLYDKKIVYLDQPFNLSCEIKSRKDEYESIINNYLQPLTNNLVIRLHPRSVNSQITCGTVDSYRNVWEIECVRQITDQHIFISVFSTAMLQPTILLDKNPYLIFLYKLYDGIYSEKQVHDIDTFLERLIKSNSKIRLAIPEKWETVESIIKELRCQYA